MMILSKHLITRKQTNSEKQLNDLMQLYMVRDISSEIYIKRIIPMKKLPIFLFYEVIATYGKINTIAVQFTVLTTRYTIKINQALDIV